MFPDYIIVGAGSAGCALANKLTQDPQLSVVLIEAGPPDTHPMIHLPGGFVKVLANPGLLWNFLAIKTPLSNLSESWDRGRTLGGSSSVNGMIYMRGHPDTYDEMGIDGWSWAEMGRVFKELEDHELGAGAWRGTGGPLRITVHSNHTALCDAFIAAFERAGIPEVTDLNAERGECVGYAARTIWRGRRQNAAVALLHPVRRRPNLTVVTGAEVRRIIFEGNQAAGIEYRDASGVQIVQAAREIILSAGTIMTPAILQRSGVGPRQLLAPLGIAVLADRQGVGQNLADNRILRTHYRVSHGSSNPEARGVRLLRNLASAYLTRSGILTDAPFWGAALAKTRPELNRPDAQFQFVPMSVAAGDATNLPEREHGATLLAWLMHPKSRGSIQITSSDPQARPRIDVNYLAHQDDRRSAVDLYNLVHRIVDQPSLAAYGAREIWPERKDRTEDEVIEMFVRDGMTGAHACGTCRIGTDADAVVDKKLRVRGVERLRVADLSVLPTVIAGNTNGPAMAVGWRAGEIIRADLPS